MMENILSVISTLAAVASVVIALMAKRDVKKLRQQIIGTGNNLGTQKVNIKNGGSNQGVISGVNSGDIRK